MVARTAPTSVTLRRRLLLVVIAFGVVTLLGSGSTWAENTPTPVIANAQPDLHDAPHLFHQDDGSLIARWVVAGVVREKRFAGGEPVALPQFASLMGERLVPRRHSPGPAIWDQPEKIVAISDVEGQYDILRNFLRGNQIIDANGNWSFGKGHLVCIGDMVDRGKQVTELMWLLYRLSAQARVAGGHVHYVLGNHEVMMMAGDVRYTARKYHAVARAFGLPTEGIVGPDTEIGRWWRSLDSMIRIGPYLFVHGGVSLALGGRPLDIVKLNEALRSVFGIPPQAIKSRQLQALAWGRQGPFWYRGYFAAHARHFGPAPTVDEMDTILRNLGAKTIVVGHTKVERIAPLFGERRVLPIDIPWTHPARVRGIVIRGKRIDVIDAQGTRRRLE